MLSIHIAQHLIDKCFRFHIFNLYRQTFFFIEKSSYRFFYRSIFNISTTDTGIYFCNYLYFFIQITFLQKCFCKRDCFFKLFLSKIKRNPTQRIMPIQKTSLLHFLFQSFILIVQKTNFITI